MANTIHLKVATADRLLVDSEVSAVECPCTTGYIGVLPGHAPLVSALGFGTLTYTPAGAGSQKNVTVKSGFIQVLDNSVRVLAGSAEIL
ncbi:MAG: F0F1 ATP synthase subunit epsilon [Acidobacteriaceae bacterium]|nr:F0F1 ATP synthase subunit epsilon [Acidobacteriaceae bacterium]